MKVEDALLSFEVGPSDDAILMSINLLSSYLYSSYGEGAELGKYHM